MKFRRVVTMLAVLSVCSPAMAPAIAHAQGASSPAGTTLEVRGFTGTKRFTLADLAKLPHQTVTASAHNVTGKFSGVPLVALLRAVGAPPSDSLRGKELADYVVIEARDGYRAVFALAELDSGYTDRVTLLADQMDGKAIDPVKDGPLRLVVPGEKRPARWVRQVMRISLMRAAP